MKRYEELTVYKTQLDGTLAVISPKIPSKCLSIDLREMAKQDQPKPDNLRNSLLKSSEKK